MPDPKPWLGRAFLTQIGDGEPVKHLWIFLTEPTAEKSALLINVTSQNRYGGPAELEIRANAQLTSGARCYHTKYASCLIPVFWRTISLAKAQAMEAQATDYGDVLPEWLAWFQKQVCEFKDEVNGMDVYELIEELEATL